jgi:hypothetical protein
VSCSMPISAFCAALTRMSSSRLCLNRRAIAILGVLNNEDHQERDDRRPSVDNELPTIGIVEYRAGDCPGDDDEYCEQKSNRPPRLKGGSSRDVGEDVLHLSRTRPGETLFPKLPCDTLCRFDSTPPILLGLAFDRWRIRPSRGSVWPRPLACHP